MRAISSHTHHKFRAVGKIRNLAAQAEWFWLSLRMSTWGEISPYTFGATGSWRKKGTEIPGGCGCWCALLATEDTHTLDVKHFSRLEVILLPQQTLAEDNLGC